MLKGVGIALMGVGLTSACLQIANTTDIKEKNEIFVETITGTTVGVLAGRVIGLFLISNPVVWGLQLYWLWVAVFFKVVVAFFNQAIFFISSFSGFNATAPTGFQLRVLPDQRAGISDLANS